MGDLNNIARSSMANKLTIILAAERVVHELFMADLVKHEAMGDAEDGIAQRFVRGMDGYVLARLLEQGEKWQPLAAHVAILDRMEGFCADIEREQATA